MDRTKTYTKEQISKEYLKGSSLRYSISKDEEIKSFIDTIELNISHKEKVYTYINDIIPKCKNPQCNKIPNFQNFNLGYKDYCSVSCSVKCSKEKQEISRIQNIQNITKDLSIFEIVDSLYKKELKIQKWREITKLDKYKEFHTLEQLYKHIVLKDNQICNYCGSIFNIDKDKNNRKCSCTTKLERILYTIINESDNIFLLKFLDDKLYLDKKAKEYYYKRFTKIEFTNSILEDIYCRINKIKEKPLNKKFINFLLGYTNIIDIDYEKPTIDILEQLKLKYGKNYKRSYEFLYFIKHFEGNSTEKQLKHVKDGYYREFKVIKKIKYIDILNKQAEIFNVDIINENKFKCMKCSNEFIQENNTSKYIICRKCTPKISGYSLQEKEVLDYIKTLYTGNILENDRSLGIELDIYIPELNFAIEYNGLYWHTSEFKDKKSHLNKTEIAEKNDVQLIQIFENEWLQKQDIVKSILKAKLGLTEKRIYARKCTIKEVDCKTSNKFLDDNHIQGKDNAPIRYGLYYEGDLVQLMTFKRSHRSKAKYMELKRSCSILNTNIIGGFSKLLKYSKKMIQEDIVTFADRRYSYKENVYTKNGTYISTIPPNHFYINGLKLESREKYQKHKLKDIVENFDEDKTAIENCHDNGLYEIYDCGNFKYFL